VLFTNYQFYIDEFIKLGHSLMADPAGDYDAFVEPGNVVTRRVGMAAQPGDEFGAAPPRLPQMPAYHLVRPDGSGISMVNIGVGPANAKTITDHIAVLRPHAWLMLGHCAGCATASNWATTCWPTPTCAKTTCWTKTCRCGCPFPHWPRCRWRWNRRWPRSRS
jgi:nucleoside phosphorylase